MIQVEVQTLCRVSTMRVKYSLFLDSHLDPASAFLDARLQLLCVLAKNPEKINQLQSLSPRPVLRFRITS